jgi:hypothetical protein
VETVTFAVDGRLACTVERPPFGCDWDPGEIVRGHHVRVVATLSGGRRLTDNLYTKDLGFTEHVRTEAVLVPVIVTQNGQFVRGLKAQDFEILEDGVKQSIASLAAEDAPLDLVLAIDVSGSMERSLDQVKAAVKQLLSKLRNGDAATLVGFNDTLFLATEREKDQKARERAVDLLSSWGGTALYDATVRAVDLVSREWGRAASSFLRMATTGAAHARKQRPGSRRAMRCLYGRLRERRNGSRAANQAGELRRWRRPFFPQRTGLDGAFDQIVAELANQHALVRIDELQAGQCLADDRAARAAAKHDIRARQGYRARGLSSEVTKYAQHSRYVGHSRWRCDGDGRGGVLALDGLRCRPSRPRPTSSHRPFAAGSKS